MTSQIKVSTPGKIILSGEHAVVYGYPALVTSVSLRSLVTINSSNKSNHFPQPEIISRGINNFENIFDKKTSGLDIKLESRIPIGSGMGSSASVAVSLAGSLVTYYYGKLEKEKISRLVNLSEDFYHKNNSGVDATIVLNGGYLWYRKETQNLRLSSNIKSKIELDDLFIVNTGTPRETTGEMVGYLAEKYKKVKTNVINVFTKIEKTTRNFLRLIEGETGNSLKEMIFENERYLEELGVVSSSTMNLVRKIEKIGGSAKISGAGGKKAASGIIIVYHHDKEKLAGFFKNEKLDVINVKFGVKGAKIEK